MQQDERDRCHDADTDVVVDVRTDGFCKRGCHDRW